MKTFDEETTAAVDRLLLEAMVARNRMEYLAYRLGNLLPEMDDDFCRDVVNGRVQLKSISTLRRSNP